MCFKKFKNPSLLARKTHFRNNGVLCRLSISTLLSSHLLSILEISCLGAQNKPSGNPLEVQNNNAKTVTQLKTHIWILLILLETIEFLLPMLGY